MRDVVGAAGQERLTDIEVEALRGRAARTGPWLRPIAEWFFCYPVLFLEAAGLLLIVLAIHEDWDLLGATQIGLPGLFWHYSTWIQLTAGFGVAAVLGEICLVGYLLDAEHKWMRRGNQLEDDGEEGRTSWWYFVVTLTFLAVLVPLVRTRTTALVALIAGIATLILVRIVPSGVAVLGAGLAGCLAGALASRES